MLTQSLRPLFRGLGPALAGSSLHFCVLMLLYEPLRDGARSRWQGLPRLVPDAAAGALAGAAVRSPLAFSHRGAVLHAGPRGVLMRVPRRRLW